jgi:NADH:ubiquinone oxidoreductase subunit 6 (subunit J)
MLGVLPGFILSWFYEVIHTFFVVTGQIVSYLTMVFWLFVFLFMFFVVERQETYFQERKKFRQDLLKKIQNIKK